MKEYRVFLAHSGSQVVVKGDDAISITGLGDLIIKKGADTVARFAPGNWSHYVVHEIVPESEKPTW